MDSRPAEDPTLERLLLAAREDERRRCARELHDETLQALGALRVQLSAARRSDDVDQLHAALDGAVEDLGREIANLRALITDLRPASLDELGLRCALEALCERASAVHGLRVEAVIGLERGEAVRLPSELETTVYRIVQEALTNVTRHACAERVQVSVRERAGEIVLAVVDDGAGFDQDSVGCGFGLTGMHERVSLAGGRLDIRTSGRGTAVQAVLPVARELIASRSRRLAYS